MNKKIALISVSDKSGVVALAQELVSLGFEVLSTGGTAKSLKQGEVSCREVQEFTGFPEILEGRVKTLHPKIFGGILYQRENPKHQSDMRDQDLSAIDCVIVNLYPFEKIHLENKIPKSEMLEFIDIGGVSLLRAAAKNFQDVIVLCDPEDYSKVIQELKENGNCSLKTRKDLAQKAFAHTAHYDSMIAKYFREVSTSDFKIGGGSKSPEEPSTSLFPEELTIGMRKISDLRYGENPQQKASLYEESGGRNWGVVHAEVLQGKELSFNNYLDIDGAWQLVHSLALENRTGSGPFLSSESACVIIKHTNPCGVAIGKNPAEAFQMALDTDPLSAFGGIIGFSKTVDEETADNIVKTFFECLIAPDYTPEALTLLKKKPNLRVLRQKTTLTLPYEFDIKKVSGGFLIQEMDTLSEVYNQENFKVVSKRAPTPEESFSLDFSWKVCKHVKSNAILLTRGRVTQGIGTGQMSRIDSLKIAIRKAKLDSLSSPTPKVPLVLASDGFFPFRDCVDEAAKVGVSAIIEPGGSIRDPESIEAANENNIALVFTGVRHFRH